MQETDTLQAKKRPEKPKKESKRRIGDLLISLGLIDEEQLGQALEAQKTIPMPLGAILVHLGYLSEDVMLSVLSEHHGVQPWPLDVKPPDLEALSKLSPEICRRHIVIPVAVAGDLLTLAMANPEDVQALEVVRYATRMRVEPVMASRFRLLQTIERIHGTGNRHSVDELVDTAVREFDIDNPTDPWQSVGEQRIFDASSIVAEAESAPVISLVSQLIQDGVRARASDIHVEPRRGRLEIRFRVDGQLRRLRDVPGKLSPMIIARLKIMADLDVAEYRLPQDGRISVRVDGRSIDLRISVIPGHHGQRVVLRILDRFVGLRKLEDVGFTQHNIDLFRDMIRIPHGVLLVTGPTGSGKTTTLYGVLSELKDESTNIITCEDPIEYEIDGVNQTQIHEKAGLTFARQLRAILRQDPDIILVGEIRDAETAETAIRAALTGHLVLSTLHSNDAVSAIPRLLDMGVEPFLLGTCLAGVVSQRLLRVLCPRCKTMRGSTELEALVWATHRRLAPLELPKANGCHECLGTGYKSRTAVHEVLPVIGSVGAMIVNREPVDAIRAEALKYRFRPIQEHALDLIEAGVTTFEEARRVVHMHQVSVGLRT